MPTVQVDRRAGRSPRHAPSRSTSRRVLLTFPLDRLLRQLRLHRSSLLQQRRKAVARAHLALRGKRLRKRARAPLHGSDSSLASTHSSCAQAKCGLGVWGRGSRVCGGEEQSGVRGKGPSDVRGELPSGVGVGGAVGCAGEGAVGCVGGSGGLGVAPAARQENAVTILGQPGTSPRNNCASAADAGVLSCRVKPAQQQQDRKHA
eukprot:362704-Chlamydomonas_euryale.AAC.2